MGKIPLDWRVDWRAVLAVLLGSAVALSIFPRDALATPPPSPLLADGPHSEYFHKADVTVGSSTYNTATQSGPVGILDTATASIATGDSEVALTDVGGISIFVSDPVPSGRTWDISGSWTFSPYIRTTVSTRLYMRARVYRIDTAGNPTQVLYTQNGSRYDTGGSYQLLQWNASVSGGTTLDAGERFGVTFFVSPKDDEPGKSAIMGFDESSTPSGVTAQIVESLLAGSVREAHYRIGQDTALTAMTWYAAVDSPWLPQLSTPAGRRFRPPTLAPAPARPRTASATPPRIPRAERSR